jgi:hypothetical protein
VHGHRQLLIALQVFDHGFLHPSEDGNALRRFDRIPYCSPIAVVGRCYAGQEGIQTVGAGGWILLNEKLQALEVEPKLMFDLDGKHTRH